MAAITQWREKGNRLYGAVLILSLMPLIEGVVSVYNKLNDFGGLVSMMNGGDGDAFGVSSSDFFVPVVMTFAYVLYFSGLTAFAKLQTEEDARSVLRIRSGAVWGVVAEVLSFVPIVGWLLSSVASIVSFFIMISGYARLRHSFTFPAEARRGAGRLRAAMIWGVVAAILHIIPLLGPVLSSVINFILFFVVLNGWSSIKHAVPLTIAGRTITDRLKITDAPNGILIALGIVLITAVPTLGKILFVNILFPLFMEDAYWDLYNYVFYFMSCLGVLLLFLGILDLYKRNVVLRKGFIILLAAAGIWLGVFMFEVISYVIIVKYQMDLSWLYRIANLLFVIAYVLFIIGFRKLSLSCPSRQMSEGTNALIGFYSLSLFQILFLFEALIFGRFWEEYGKYCQLLPWLCLYLGFMGWRSILSALYGKGEIVPTDNRVPGAPDVRESASSWIPQEEENIQSIVEDKEQQEAMRRKTSLKTDDELSQILANSEDYNPALVEAASEEKERRAQEAAKVADEEARREAEMQRYAPKYDDALKKMEAGEENDKSEI